MEQQPYSFADEKVWTDVGLEERVAYLGTHILLISQGTPRHHDICREIEHVVYELSARNVLAQQVELVVQ